MAIAVESERRVFARFSARFPVRFKDSRDEFGTNVFLLDASATGAHILTEERMFLDDPVSLEVALPDGNAPMVLRGKVVWTKPDAVNALWDVGLHFPRVHLMGIHRLFRLTQS